MYLLWKNCPICEKLNIIKSFISDTLNCFLMMSWTLLFECNIVFLVNKKESIGSIKV